MMPASASRPAPRLAEPFEFKQVRYQQDREETPDKAFGAAYLAATSISSGQLLWSLKIADAIQYPPGSPWQFGPIYIEKIEAAPIEDALILVTQHGKRYQVDLKNRHVHLIYDPADFIEPDERRNWSVPPPPPPLPTP